MGFPVSSKQIITVEQFDQLQGFFLHCWSVYHEKADKDFSFYRGVLDKAGVNWVVQNAVSIIAEKKSNYHSNLKVLLRARNIFVKNKC